MSSKVIVLVSDRDDSKHGEISVMEDLRKAERLVETLLQAGFEQERIRVFTGNEMDMQITHRPMVALVGGEAEGDSPEEIHQEVTRDEGEPSEDETAEQEMVEVHAEEKEEAPVAAYYQGGVRFSSLFRSA